MSDSDSVNDLLAIGLAVQQVRERSGRSEAEVEARADLGEGSLTSIERGLQSPTWGELRRIVYAIGISLPDLMEVVEEIESRAPRSREAGERGPA
jgi:transcriptional regulator with XRE-family HTH domain